MVELGPAFTASTKQGEHYRYVSAVFALTGLTFAQVLQSTGNQLPGFSYAGGVSLIVPPVNFTPVNRIRFRSRSAALINNTVTGNYVDINAKTLGIGNIVPGQANINVDGFAITGFVGDDEHIDIAQKINRINIPSVGLFASFSGADFLPAVVTPAPGPVHGIAVFLTVDVYAYRADADFGLQV